MNALGERVLGWVSAALAGRSARPLVVGLNAPQGAGKTTLATQLVAELAASGRSAVSVSVDDFYLTREEQLALAHANPTEPLLEHRGYPGTHDLELGRRTLEALRAGRPVDLPRYDKSAHAGRGDRSRSTEHVARAVDVVFFDGWLLGFAPSEAPPPELRRVNTLLAGYRVWHELVDVMVWLRVDDPSVVIEWRAEAEDRARASGRPALSRADIEDYARRFVPAYQTWRVQGPWPTLELHLGRDRSLVG